MLQTGFSVDNVSQITDRLQTAQAGRTYQLLRPKRRELNCVWVLGLQCQNVENVFNVGCRPDCLQLSCPPSEGMLPLLVDFKVSIRATT